VDFNCAKPLFHEIVDGVLWSERELGETLSTLVGQ
jgi:hypothetical protein